MSFLTLHDIVGMPADAGRRIAGGKAANLAILQQKGFRIPRACVIPTSDFEAEVSLAFAKLKDLSEPRQCVADMTLSSTFVASLREACQFLGTSRFAIRSSATDEDSAEHSFAGMLESIIGVDADACPDAVKRVWSSFYARERLMFPSQAALDAPIPSMAVLLQEYIPSDIAGVIFTRHPLEGQKALLINVTHGEGETVVSGKGGETITIQREAADLAELPTSETLTPFAMRELILTALRVEEALGTPQDIEFAFSNGELILLQTRAIAANADPHANANHLFSNTNVGEALCGVCTPMTWSIGMSYAKHGFQTIFHAAGLSVPEHYRFVTTFFGHIYLNISEILSVASQVPFVSREMFGRIAGIPHISDYVCDIERMSRARFLSLAPISIFRILKNLSRVRQLEKRKDAFRTWRDAFLAQNTHPLSHEERRRAFDELYEQYIQCGDDMLAAATSCLISYFFVSQCLSRNNKPHSAEIETYFFSQLKNVQSAAPGLELQAMARDIAQSPNLKAMFLDEDFAATTPEAFFKRIEHTDDGLKFIRRFNTFLQNYGARANQEAEIANPRWHEDPRFLFQVIQNHLRAPKSNTPIPPQAAEDFIEDFEHSLAAPQRVTFRKLLAYAREATRKREVWRAYVVDILDAFRRFLRGAAPVMIEQKIIACSDDVFFLTIDEIRQWLTDPHTLDDARLRIAFRRARHQAFLSAQTLPSTFTRHPNACQNIDPCTCQNQLRGLPASAGCVRARVRVIRDLKKDAANFQYGDIIAAVSTDVGWTPLFLLASAILTEQGGPLSHAVVVAREYGIPAIVSIPNLLNTIKTGDLVTVSAEKGIVTIESQNE